LRKTLGGAGGVVMLSTGMVGGVPWIVFGALAVWFALLVFVNKLAFCNRGGGEPTRRVIALVRAVKAPSSPPGRRNRTRAKPPGQP